MPRKNQALNRIERMLEEQTAIQRDMLNHRRELDAQLSVVQTFVSSLQDQVCDLRPKPRKPKKEIAVERIENQP